MKELPDHILLEPLSKDGSTVLFRAVSKTTSNPALIRFPVSTPPLDHEVREIELEFSMGLRLPELSVPLQKIEVSGTPVLIVESYCGEPLTGYPALSGELLSFLDVSIAIAAGLNELHGKGLIHTNLSPDNILVDRNSLEVRFIGLSGVVRGGRSYKGHFREVAPGRVPYLAPEQSGRVRWDVDERTDLYSLGVVLFRLLTGRLPFDGRSPHEWIYFHLAIPPLSASQFIPSLPQVVGQILNKLLEKSPDNRYQSAKALIDDLERCRHEFERSREVSQFTLATSDRLSRLRVPSRLHGRESHLAHLMAAFERTLSTNSSEVLFISGDPGVGKRALLEEFERQAWERDALVLRLEGGTQDDSPLVEGVRRLLREILSQSNEEVGTLKKLRLFSRIGDAISALVDSQVCGTRRFVRF